MQSRHRLTAFSLPSFGPCAIEDFVPVTEERALVTAGPHLRKLSFILDVHYRFGDGTLDLSDPAIVREGDYLRLGHLHDDEGLVYSEGWEGPHQPFRHDGSLYYSDDAPSARLYRDGKVLIDRWDGVAEVGNPWVDDFIWFEARAEGDEAPWGWHLYRANLDGSNVTKLFVGANPCMFRETLYYGLWNGRGFDIARADRRHCLPADAYLST